MVIRMRAAHFWRLGQTAVILVAVWAILLSAQIAHAAQPLRFQPAPMVVNNDRGGLINDRLRQMRTLLKRGQRVEIRGDFCFSTCTMLLGMPNVCILPGTAFGFHGPSRLGRPLEEQVFRRASLVIAGFYPEGLRDWYLNTARFQIDGVMQRSGAELIRMGIRSCEPKAVSMVQ